MRLRLNGSESRRTARRPLGGFGLVALVGLVALAPSCAPPLDTERTPPKRGTVGQEMYGVLCDRLSAQALREDLTGGSFRDVCHAKRDGSFEDKVDLGKLPPYVPGATDGKGKPITVETQRDVRERAIGRIEALARRRVELVRAFDAMFPEDTRVGVKDLDNPDPKKSCGAPPGKKSEAKLTTALADMLGRMTDLYHDGTLSQSTLSLGRVVDAFRRDEEAQAAWARIASRDGYRPVDTALGVARPAVAYPALRDLSNASLRLLSADSQPYQLDPKRDDSGLRIPVPGPGNAALNAMLEAAHEELLDPKRDPKPGALTVTTDAISGRVVLSRARDNLEIMQELLYKTDPAFSVGAPRWIVKRDARGYAAIAGGLVPTPFVDADKDGLPDVDDRGRFVTTNGSLAPSPFPYPNGPQTTRDEAGRALAGTRLLYDYLDTSSTFAAQITKDLRPLADPDPQKEALMGVLGGIYVAMGPKGPANKSYPQTTLQYDGFLADSSPMLDLVHAATTLLGDRNMDATLAMAKDLVQNHPKALARLVGGLLTAQDLGKTHDEAKIPKTATLWDELLDDAVKLAKEPGLLEDVLRATTAPESEGVGQAFANFAKFKDEVRYDYDDINGGPFNVTTSSRTEPKTPVDRAQPQIGPNRSALYRFLGLINDAQGVAACNREGAVLHARGLPGNLTADICESGGGLPVYAGCTLGRPFKECELYKIPDLGEFYVQSIAGVPGRGAFNIRYNLVRSGIGGFAAANAETMELSSGIKGFWGSDLRPKPEWLNRVVFFDFAGDTKNKTAKDFIGDMNGEFFGSSLCPERVIDDPVPTAIDADKDGKVRLRSCPNGSWIQQRHKRTLFVLENFGFYPAIRPLAAAFVSHKREDIFISIAATIYKHYPGEEPGNEAECKLPGNKPCPKTGALSYEGAVADVMATDIFGGLGDLSRALDKMNIKRCDEADAQGKCTKVTNVSGIEVAAAAARAALDPDYARSTLKLTDRRGVVTAKRNDGATNPQVTPLYLVLQALNAIDDAFDAYEQQSGDKERRTSWRRARSQMVDQFLGVDGARVTATFRNPTLTKMGPTLVDVLRSQLIARCPRSFNAPFERCTWARDDLPKKATDALAGPLASAGLEMMEAIRKDASGRQEMAKMVQYLTDAGSSNDALASMLASMNDVVQMLRDDDNLVPFYRVLAAAMDASKKDARGRVTEASLVDAQMALLARVSGRAFDAENREICSREVDPNQILSKVLANAVTPIADADFKGQAPIEVVLDVIADVNRRDPREPYEGTLAREDYTNVSDEVWDFLVNKERGLEQFYEVVRQGTKF